MKQPLIGLMLGLLLAGCGASGSAPASPASAPAKPSSAASASSTAKPQTTASAAAKPLTKVIEALPTRDFGYLPTIVAQSKGFFAEGGLEVETPVMASQAAIPALTS